MSADKAPAGSRALPNIAQRVFSTLLRATPSSDQGTDGQELDRLCFWDVGRLNDHFIVLHALVRPSPRNSTEQDAGGCSVQHASSSGRLAWALEKAQSYEGPGSCIFTFLLPASGYVTRGDYLQARLQGCHGMVSILDGLAPSGNFTNPLCQSSSDIVVIESGKALSQLAELSAAVIQWRDPCDGASEAERRLSFSYIGHELAGRFNAPWLCQEPVARKRVALVRGRPDLITGEPIYLAARALGVDLVVVDDEGHWLQADTEENKQYREAFLATDMTEDSGVIERITKSLQSYPLPIHGIFTVSDNFFVVVAQVAAALGLPTCPASAFEVSVDKYRSRLLQDSPGHTARVSSVEEMLALIEDPQPANTFSPTFPMIVKPVKGWSSECVSKVSSLEDLKVAVKKATDRHEGAAVVEPFFDGPEIDVNFVLLDGQILFSEVADEQPGEADAHDATVDDTFSAWGLTLPSALPSEEQEMAKATMHKILIDLGFLTGVFHVEARIVNSRCEYRKVDGDMMDLVPKPADRMPKEEASCRLLEINARPPAYRVTLTTKHTYGVDFFAAHILAAIGDHQRLALAAMPFDFGAGVSDRTQYSQCWSRLLYLSAPVEGIVKTEEPCEDLKRRKPDLAKHIVLSGDYRKKGDKVALFSAGARTCIGHIVVWSHVSRREVMELGESARRHFKFEVEEPAKPCDG